MFTRLKLENTQDCFTGLSQRKDRGVYFCRISGWNGQIHDFILRYYEAAGKNGVIIDGKLPNPDPQNLTYYQEIMGTDFQMNPAFINARLKKWLPRMNDRQRENVTASIYTTLSGLHAAGKNENMLRNTYCKFMCWLYYKFERIVNSLGAEQVPKILYEGEVSLYVLLMLNVLCRAGCDIVLVQKQGEAPYRSADPAGEYSTELSLPGMEVFPADFSLKGVREEIRREQEKERLFGPRPEHTGCVNTWADRSRILEEVRREPAERGNDSTMLYHLFYRIRGVEDKTAYQNDLFLLQKSLKEGGRHVLIFNGRIDPPRPDEIQAVRRGNYQNASQMILDLSANIRGMAAGELQRLMQSAFARVMLDEETACGGNISRLTGKAVYLLCWLRRYQEKLFGGWRAPAVAAVLYMGACASENEALFLRFLAHMPADVLLFVPELEKTCVVKDPLLEEIRFDGSMSVKEFPENGEQLRIGTAAYHAERELDTLLYQGSGFFRDQQYARAETVTLQTIYEEIPVLWNQELKYRPGFHAGEETVSLPVIFSKISGVKNADERSYWNTVRGLITPDTQLITTVPNIGPAAPNPMKAHAASFWKNGRLQKAKIREQKEYPYGILRETMQEHLLDQIQALIAQKTIRGTFENGTEYTIIATALNLDKNLLRMIQKFDFTKKNPKLVYIMTGENALSLEDTIQAAFLNRVGFDILFFVPTGYQCVERFFNRSAPEEHQTGEYLYDLQVPDLRSAGSNRQQHLSWRDRIFKRGM